MLRAMPRRRRFTGQLYRAARSPMGGFRRALLGLAGALLLTAAVALAADFSPHAGSYSGLTGSGHAVQFQVDVLERQIKNFDVGGKRLFDAATFKDVNGTWSFEHASATYRVDGQWSSAGNIRGTIEDAIGLSAHYDASHVEPHGGLYSACSTTGPRVEFRVDLQTQHVKDFTLNGYQYFTITTFFHNGKWRFVHSSFKYEISGEWIRPGEVSGSISNQNYPSTQSFCARG
jgi:hypothetical protein